MVYWVRDWSDILDGPGSNPAQFMIITFAENFNFSKFFEKFLLYQTKLTTLKHILALSILGQKCLLSVSEPK